MVCQRIRALWWSSEPGLTTGPDLEDRIDDIERQLRVHINNAPSREQVPLFSDLPPGVIPPEREATLSRRATHLDQTSVIADRREEAPSRLGYSSKPLRIVGQLLLDLILLFTIVLGWLFDLLLCFQSVLAWLLGLMSCLQIIPVDVVDRLQTVPVWLVGRLQMVPVWLTGRWYRWLLVALPLAFYTIAYKFITRELVQVYDTYQVYD